jgi:hypothetical protein
MRANLTPGRWRHRSALDTDLVVIAARPGADGTIVDGFLVNRHSGIEYRPSYFIKGSTDMTEVFVVRWEHLENWTPVSPP